MVETCPEQSQHFVWIQLQKKENTWAISACGLFLLWMNVLLSCRATGLASAYCGNFFIGNTRRTLQQISFYSHVMVILNIVLCVSLCKCKFIGFRWWLLTQRERLQCFRYFLQLAQALSEIRVSNASRTRTISHFLLCISLPCEIIQIANIISLFSVQIIRNLLFCKTGYKRQGEKIQRATYTYHLRTVTVKSSSHTTTQTFFSWEIARGAIGVCNFLWLTHLWLRT